MPSAESLLTELTGADPRITALIAGTGPLIVPFDTLTDNDGWLVDLAGDQGAAPFDDPSLPADQRIVNALLVACDYAIRRGAQRTDDTLMILRRESPVGVNCETGVVPYLQSLVDLAGIGGSFPQGFSRRKRGHELAGTVKSDPALSFKERSIDEDIGDNALSSLIVFAGGDTDCATASGEIAERWAVEIGLPSDAEPELIDAVEREAALMPSYLRGIMSFAADDGIVVGWPLGHAPDPQHIAVVIWAWTKALFDLPTAEVRVVFAPQFGESIELTEMRARADALRMYRDASIPGGAKSPPGLSKVLPGG